MEKYAIEKVIGEGTYGVVYRATEKGSNDQVAIKKFKTVQDEQLSKREIQACSMLSHAYIVSYRHNFRHDGLLHLVFDHVPDSMHKLLARNRRGIKPVQAQRLIYQLCQALQYCHASRVIHRDVKPDNILIDDNGDIRLCDFGVARTIQFEGDPLSDYVATRWYRPPEQELRLDRYSFDADMWSVGCVLVELLTGRPLFPGSTQIDQLNLIQEFLGPLPPTLAARLPRGVAVVKSATKSFEQLLGDRDLPDGTIDFLYQTIHLDPRQRLSAAASLKHAFLKPLHDADQRARRHRQQEEKQRRSNGSTDSEDGIEEDLPGGPRATAEAKSPARAATPSHKRSVGFKGEVDDDESPSSSKPTRKSPRRGTPAHSERKAHGTKLSRLETNPADNCDSDDIQEIIEMDELSLCAVEPKRPSGPRSPDRQQQHKQEMQTRQASPCKPKASGGTRRVDVPASDHHECYEDDFES